MVTRKGYGFGLIDTSVYPSPLTKSIIMTDELKQLKAQLEEVEMQMPQTFAQQSSKHRAMFLLSRAIEKLESPAEYERNIAHWEGHELRF